MRRKHDEPVLITEKLQSSTPWLYLLSCGSSATGYSYSSSCPANGSISLDEIGKTHVCLEIPKRPCSAPQNPRSGRSWYGDLLTFYMIKKRVGPQLAFNSVFLGFELLKLYRILSQASPGTFPCWQVLPFRIYALSFLKLKISCLSWPHLTWARVERITWAKYVLTNWSHCRRETKSTLEINPSGIVWGSSKYCTSG